MQLGLRIAVMIGRAVRIVEPDLKKLDLLEPCFSSISIFDGVKTTDGKSFFVWPGSGVNNLTVMTIPRGMPQTGINALIVSLEFILS